MNVESTRRRLSNRIYDGIPCKKDDCDEIFQPSDSRQKYCCPQHRIDHNNDLRKANDKELLELSKKMKHNDTVLEKIYNNQIYKKAKSVAKELLVYEGFFFNIVYEKQINTTTNKYVLWMIKYGLEAIDIENRNFIIHKK